MVLADKHKCAKHFQLTKLKKQISLMRTDIDSITQLMGPIEDNAESLRDHQLLSERSNTNANLPPKSSRSSVAIQDYISTNDPLVSKCYLLERRVHECLNKLHCAKQEQLNAALPEEKSRNPIEIEFKKKKIHFVSEFKLYDERWQLKLV